MRKYSKKHITEVVLQQFESELDALVDDAFQGKGFDYDDYIEMTGQVRNNYSIRFFLKSDLCAKIQDFIEELPYDEVDGDEYDVLEDMSAEFSMRLEEKIQDSLPYSNHNMVAKTVVKRLKRAYISLFEDVESRVKNDTILDTLKNDDDFMLKYKNLPAFSRFSMVEDYLIGTGVMAKVKEVANELAEETGANEHDVRDAIESYVAEIMLCLDMATE